MTSKPRHVTRIHIFSGNCFWSKLNRRSRYFISILLSLFFCHVSHKCFRYWFQGVKFEYGIIQYNLYCQTEPRIRFITWNSALETLISATIRTCSHQTKFVNFVKLFRFFSTNLIPVSCWARSSANGRYTFFSRSKTFFFRKWIEFFAGFYFLEPRAIRVD